MNHELLVPAGDMECLHQAVYNGADAVYISGMNFGARKFATNFTKEELIDAIKFCHLYGVRLYVTMNTLIKNNEVDSFIEQARFLHKNGVDALIVQDFGMICLLRKKFPNLEIHASTQVNNSSKDTCRLLYKLGVKRVVFSRELSIDEINNIDVPIEKEAFIHGALCVSYSGCCLMSSMLGGRSGNRGECAGCCRLPFSLVSNNHVIKNNEYLLSMKELNTSSRVKDLLNSTIYSFKIEGRMKSPLYVGFITNFYRRLIDGDEINIDGENDKLKTIFNRDFTIGHIFGVEGISLINSSSPNHIGLKIGHASIKKDKIKLILDNNQILNQFDAIRFLNSKKGIKINYLYDKNMNLCSSAKGVCYVDNKINLTCNDILTKTHSFELEKEYKSSSNKRKVSVDFKVFAKVGEKLKISVSDGINTITETANMVEKSINASTKKETFIKQLSKVGDTVFKVNDITFDVDNDIFVQIKVINEIRRNLLDKLSFLRKTRSVDFVENDFCFEKNSNNIQTNEIICSVNNEEQLEACLDKKVNKIYIKDIDLYNKYSDMDNMFLFLNRCLYDYKKHNKKRVVVSDLFDYKDYIAVGNYSLNVTNIYTAYFLKKYGLLNIPLSVELNSNELSTFITDYNEKIGYDSFELLVYGRVENMIIKSNILDIDTNNFSYSLIDKKGRMFPVYYDGCNTHIYNYENNNNFFDINCNYRFDFYDENKKEVEEILNNYVKNN